MSEDCKYCGRQKLNGEINHGCEQERFALGKKTFAFGKIDTGKTETCDPESIDRLQAANIIKHIKGIDCLVGMRKNERKAIDLAIEALLEPKAKKFTVSECDTFTRLWLNLYSADEHLPLLQAFLSSKDLLIEPVKKVMRWLWTNGTITFNKRMTESEFSSFWSLQNGWHKVDGSGKEENE